MRDVSEESLLDYFYCSGGTSGRVRNADMLKTFKPFIGHTDGELRAKYREEFKLIIDRIAVVKSENVSKLLQYFYLMWRKLCSHLFCFHLYCFTMCSHCSTPAQSSGEDELDKDTGWKVTLDPIEKEWIYSAAGARVPDLSQLLRQDSSLANKKVTALHWAAKHGNKDMATLVANAGADVNTKSVSGYTPLHIAALHGHQHILDLLIGTYGAKVNVRDYSGRLAFHYLNMKEPEVPEEECELQFQVTQVRERNKNRKLVSLFHSKKKWGSAEELAPIEEERTASNQLALPPFRPRKFSR
uniref:SOWAHA-C winged helix-turn-helix domain-containing protein n=1 Tax=Anabas testudineus TaxID=64144 RepID=A0A3Q1JKC5_ANATE